MEDIIWQI